MSREKFKFWTLKYCRKISGMCLRYVFEVFFCFNWNFAGMTLILPWYYSDTVLILSWYYYSILMVWLRYRYDTKLKLKWYRNSIMVFSFGWQRSQLWALWYRAEKLKWKLNAGSNHILQKPCQWKFYHNLGGFEFLQDCW